MKRLPLLEARRRVPRAIYQYIYALPKGELAAHGILLRSKRTRRRSAPAAGRRGAPIVAMTSIDAREDIADRKVPEPLGLT